MTLSSATIFFVLLGLGLVTSDEIKVTPTNGYAINIQEDKTIDAPTHDQDLLHSQAFDINIQNGVDQLVREDIIVPGVPRLVPIVPFGLDAIPQFISLEGRVPVLPVVEPIVPVDIDSRFINTQLLPGLALDEHLFATGHLPIDPERIAIDSRIANSQAFSIDIQEPHSVPLRPLEISHPYLILDRPQNIPRIRAT